MTNSELDLMKTSKKELEEVFCILESIDTDLYENIEKLGKCWGSLSAPQYIKKCQVLEENIKSMNSLTERAIEELSDTIYRNI